MMSNHMLAGMHWTSRPFYRKGFVVLGGSFGRFTLNVHTCEWWWPGEWANMMKQLDEAVDSDVQSTLSALDSLCDAPVPLPNSLYLHGFGTVSSWFLHILWSSFSKWSVRSDSDTGSGNHCGLSGKIEVPKSIYQYDQSPSSSNLFSLPCIYNSWKFRTQQVTESFWK